MNAADRTWEQVEALGFEKPDKPDGLLPPLPHDITVLSGSQLMHLHGEYLAWAEYAGARLVDCRSIEKDLKLKLAHSSAQAARNATEKTVAGRKAAATADPGVQRDEQRLADASSLVAAMDLVHENITRRVQFCSRDLSRRQISGDHELRASKWAA
ncbi:hypothetical protein ABZ543_12785 [Streptomyces roseifaciens]